MALELMNIIFNHDPNSFSTSAMNIRRNKDYEIPIPEYDSSISRTVDESSAAYSISETKSQQVFIKIKLKCTSPILNSVTYEVKASDGGILGEIDPFKVTFTPTETTKTVKILLNNRNFNEIGSYDVSWEWSYTKVSSFKLQYLATTTHRIYLVLKVPESPFNQIFGDKKNPWTELLEKCCKIAMGCTDEITATSKITQQIYSSYNLRYDIKDGADRYGFWNTGDKFNLTNWINYVLKGNAPNYPKFCPGTSEEYKNYLIVNCYDCAASLALMSKILGVSIDYYFHQPFGYLKYVFPIGRGLCNNPFTGCSTVNSVVGPDDPRSWFGNHAYTKINGIKCYDACMKLQPRIIKLLEDFIIDDLKQIIKPRYKIPHFIFDLGWLVNLEQNNYNYKVIDTSTPKEASSTSGKPPIKQDLDFNTI